MKRIRVDRPRIPRERAWTEDPPADPRDPDVVPGYPGRPASAVEQMQDIFHELHADGRNAACTVCDGQYWSA